MIVSRAITTEFNMTGRMLEGRAIPYVVPARVTDDGGRSHYFEQLLRGCSKKSILDRAGSPFELVVWHGTTSNRGHMPAESIGDVRFTESEHGLDYVATVNRSALGDEMLEMAGDGLATDNSLSYRPIDDVNGVHDGELLVSRAVIALKDLSLCPAGTAQHPGSKVLVMRAVDAVPQMSAAEVRLRLLDLR